jgi:formate hydrogenlyase subunit 4
MIAWLFAILQTLLFISLAPLLIGLVRWLKAQLQNREGPSLLQPYRDLIKLFRKNVIVANTASPIFRLTPYIVFSITVLASAAIPILVVKLPTTAITDVIVLVGLFGLARFFLSLAGLDIGTAFGGMGSSREMLISAIAEPALLMVFFSLAMIASTTNLSMITANLIQHHFLFPPSLIFVLIGFAMVALAENGRIPIDNPTTHLELTMIHEAMILEYSGRYLALIEWSAQIKFMLYCVLIINLFFPWGISNSFDLSALLFSAFTLTLKVITLCIILAVTEINLAKLRLFRAPFLLNMAFLLCLLGLLNHIILEIGVR